jgi:hypothetical protein
MCFKKEKPSHSCFQTLARVSIKSSANSFDIFPLFVFLFFKIEFIASVVPANLYHTNIVQERGKKKEGSPLLASFG